MNVYPVFYNLGKYGKNYDPYGSFVKNSLVERINSKEDLSKVIKRLIRHKPYVRHRAKYYIETVDTENDGHSAQIARDIILSAI